MLRCSYDGVNQKEDDYPLFWQPMKPFYCC